MSFHSHVLVGWFVFEDATNRCCVKSTMLKLYNLGLLVNVLHTADTAVSALFLIIGTKSHIQEKSRGSALLPL